MVWFFSPPIAGSAVGEWFMKMGIVAVQRLEDFIKSYWNFDILLWDTRRPGPGGGSNDAHHQGAFKMLGLVLTVCVMWQNYL